jgi:hypothetical protein
LNAIGASQGILKSDNQQPLVPIAQTSPLPVTTQNQALDLADDRGGIGFNAFA